MSGVFMATAWPAIVCPEDGEALAPGGGEITCPRGHRWIVRGGIPRMVPGGANYADAFGLQWNTYRKTQLDSYTGFPLSRDRAQRCIGEAAWWMLNRDARTDVLEVG